MIYSTYVNVLSYTSLTTKILNLFTKHISWDNVKSKLLDCNNYTTVITNFFQVVRLRLLGLIPEALVTCKTQVQIQLGNCDRTQWMNLNTLVLYE